MNPFSLLPGEASRFCADHTEFFAQNNSTNLDPETVFHSDYFWLGSGKRVFDVILKPINNDTSQIEIRVHRFKTLASSQVDCIASSIISFGSIDQRVHRIEVDTEEEYSYAILAKVRRGSCVFKNIEIKSYPSHLIPPLAVAVLLVNESTTELTPA
jgi:hypothetical protein